MDDSYKLGEISGSMIAMRDSMSALVRRMEALETIGRESNEEIHKIKHSVANLEMANITHASRISAIAATVDELSKLRIRVIGIAVGIGMIGGVVWYFLAAPIKAGISRLFTGAP